MSTHKISKSQYLKGLQCPKALWFYRHRKDLKPEITAEQQALFDTGTTIGKLAQQYFSDGVEIESEYWDISSAVDATQQHIQSGEKIIFEATAIHSINGSYSRIDVFKRSDTDKDLWDLIEVKGSTNIQDYHYDDVAFQYYVFNAAGYRINRCYMMLLDNSYCRSGALNTKKLFKLKDISDEVIARQAEVEGVAGQLGYVLDRKKEPDISIGAHCLAPFECGYKKHCWKHVPKYSVYNVFQKSKAEEISKKHGVFIEKLPQDIRPGGVKALDIESFLNKEKIIDTKNIQAFLAQLEYPLYFLDYETIMPAVPIFDGTRPFQQIPFQYSLHIQHAPSPELIHKGFLHKEQTDPREAFVQKLVQDCGTNGTVIVYNQAFEITRNKELAEAFPQYATEIKAINDRVIDLLIPFKKRWLYHPDQKSSASIKAVLPVFTDLSYDDLEIANGGDAMRKYGEFMSGKLSSSELSALWKNLSKYCEQDTYAMVKLLDVLKVIIKS